MGNTLQLTLATTENNRTAVYHIQRDTDVLGSVVLMQQPTHAEWTLPTLSEPWDANIVEQLAAAYLTLGIAQGVGQIRAWLPVADQKPRVSEVWSWGKPYRWLQATTYSVEAQPPFVLRYPAAEDGVALAHASYTAGANSVVGAHTTLGATFDAMFALWGGDWGAVLEACSCVLEQGASLTGAALTTVYGNTPLIATLTAPTPSIADELLLTVLDALASFRYPTVNLLLLPQSELLVSAHTVGFRFVEDVTQGVAQR